MPGDFGVWVEGDDGTRKMVNLGLGWVATAPSVALIQEDEVHELPFSVPGDATLTGITLHRVSDPGRDADEERLRLRIYRDDTGVGRVLVYEDELQADFSQSASIYGGKYVVIPDDDVLLPLQTATGELNSYVLEITVIDGGPVMFAHNVSEAMTQVMSDVSVGLQMQADQTLTAADLNFTEQPLLTGHGDDIPGAPTHWTPGGSDPIQFQVPIDGVIRQIDIPHLGDVLRDADEETIRLTLVGPDGSRTSATVTADFNAGADPLGQPQTVIFDPPLTVRRTDDLGARQLVTLVVEAQDPVYTSGPVVAWEGDWDDPIPWPVCPIPDDMVYRNDLPSGLSHYRCISMNMYGTHYQGIKLWMMAEDNEQKLQAMTNALDQTDYLVITSNRFYDSLSRIPMRWPMTAEYYDALFDGRLGFELVKTFESVPELGPFKIRDEVLPTDDLPGWLNDWWESEEAFSVYDHPVVMVFRKTDVYTAANTRAVLTSVSLRQANTVIPGYVADPEPVGVVVWGAKQASESPTLLQLSDEKRDIQTEGGTWSDLFDSDWLVNTNQVAAVIIWWALMVIVGWLFWPLLYVSLPALPDRGFPAAKITGWLLVAWIAWAGGTLNLLTWTRAGLLIILLALAALGVILIWPRRAAFRRYIRLNWRHLLLMELLTLALFLVLVGVRLGNPDLWHGSFGGEKPMDMAYFNGVLRSTVFPPLDPWYSGGYINYYYFGYVIVGAPVKLIGLRPTIAYNLILPTLYAMTGIGVFSIAYNWVRSRQVTPGALDATARRAKPGDVVVRSVLAESGADFAEPVSSAAPPSRPRAEHVPRAPRGNAWLAGLLALLMAIVLGNLATMHVVITEVAKLGGWEDKPLLSQVRRQELESQRLDIYQDFYDDELNDFRDKYGRDPTDSESLDLTQAAQVNTEDYITDRSEHPPLVRTWEYGLENLREKVSAFFDGLERVSSGEPLAMHTHRWYWAPTRIIAELPNGAGHNAIAEMPYFTFLYGDLHAHMIAMPVTLLVMLWLLSEIIGAGHGLRTWWQALLALVIGGTAVGALRPTNSWDWITYLLLGGAALTYAAWLDAVRASRDKPPSRAAAWLWSWIRPHKVAQAWPVVIVVPLALIARVVYYFYQESRADEQAGRLLRPGETLINPTLTFSSAVVWMVAALALVIVLYVALLIVLRAYVDKRVMLAWIGRVGLFVLVTVIAGLPFTSYFATAYMSVKPWEYETTPLWAYLYVHGLFLFIVVSLLIWQTARWLRRVRVGQLEGLAVPVIGGGVILALVLAGALIVGVRDIPAVQVAVPLIAWAVVLFLLPDQSALLRAMYALIVLALAITIGVEVIVLDGDIGRQNTVFKFYIQEWLMLSIVGGVGLAWMLRSAVRWNLALRSAWQTALAILFAVAFMYPVLATQARFLDRFNADETPLTLDGMEYMRHAIHGEFGVWFRLEGDYNMIRWMQDNVEGSPVVMEAHLYPSEYHWGGRISIYTGLPTVLGWNWHQRQQRTLPPMDMMIQARANNIAAFYELPGEAGIQAALRLIDEYEIEYIVVGILERAFYSDVITDLETSTITAGHSDGLAKFDRMVDLGLLDVAYSAPGCLLTDITEIEECPTESVYMDMVYRVVPGVTLSDEIVSDSIARDTIAAQ
ncbi:MAG: hypothetical protein JW966_15765 [Anaerolineae bacterium]|nr:hypothetical protein [Anaerolineae bacterium]